MDNSRQITYRKYDGPNIVAPFAAAVIEFPVPFAYAVPSQVVKRLIAELLAGNVPFLVHLPDKDADLADICAALSTGWQDMRGPNGLPIQVERLEDQRARIAIGFYDAGMAISALQVSIELANAIFTRHSGGVVNSARLQAFAKQLQALAMSVQPDSITRAIMRVARANDIPVYAISPGARVWMYGQGAEAVRFSEAASERESFLGVRLVKNKIHSNRMIHRLGLPGVQFGIADTPKTARDIAHRLGFPVVTKPPDRDKGKGVTLAIETDQELDAGFEEARALSGSGVVLVEKFYDGDHHRLSVFGGHFKRATQLRAAHVVGDGVSALSELIRKENESRTDAEIAAGFVKRLQIDSAMLSLLAKQGYGLDDCPPKGTKLLLRKTSNIATGGKLSDVTPMIHPDNVAMAEAVARNFWLDGAGIDFVTPDISKSWREIECAIVEVNSPPGVTSDYLAEKVLSEKFPPGRTGRIPSVLIVDGEAEISGLVAGRFSMAGKGVGTIDRETTFLGGQQRFIKNADLPARIIGLLLDPACEALVVSCSAADIEKYGLPHTRYDIALIGNIQSLPAEVRKLIEAQVPRHFELATADDIDDDIATAIAMAINGDGTIPTRN